MNNINHLLNIVALICLLTACNQGPKVISSSENSTGDNSSNTGIFNSDNASPPQVNNTTSIASDVHTVKVLEVLPTQKYVYLRVSEGDKEFWIATGKIEVVIGERYFYKNGILKTNFESKEHNRIFEQVYLVGNIVPANHGGEQTSQSDKISIPKSIPQKTKKIDVEGSIKIAELVRNARQYEGKVVQISGNCVKLNPNIMGRNWIHLQDGSNDEYDLVVTSDQLIPEGHLVTMKGTVVLDKDFGAGYKYDIIIENGTIVNNNPE